MDRTLGLEPFIHEPHFTAEEIQRRREERAGQAQGPAPDAVNINPHRERIRILQQRLDGDIPIEEWCMCSNCRIPQKPTVKMCQCCHEHSALDEKMGGDVECITRHDDFDAVCLTPAVLHIIINSLTEVRGYGPNGDGWTNRLYRHVAYRAYTYWVHQRLGRYNRIATPACVVLAIRKRFPEENDDAYVSFKEADEVGDAWHL